jgi:hypothetical protein
LPASSSKECQRPDMQHPTSSSGSGWPPCNHNGTVQHYCIKPYGP